MPIQFLHVKRNADRVFWVLFFFFFITTTMADWESVKKARLEYDSPASTLIPQQQSQQLPFSRYLSNSYQHNQKHPILTDKKLIVYDLKG
jgi:hypothetical protein